MRVVALWASLVLCDPIPFGATSPAAPNPPFIQGAWACDEASRDATAAPPDDVQAQFARVFPLESASISDAHLAVGIRNELDAVLGRLLAEMHFLRIGLTAGGVAIVDDTGRNDYSLPGHATTHTVAGVGVRVTALWTAPSLVLDIAGDHGLDVRETFEPDVEGARLLVRWDLLFPKTKVPLVVTRLYQRLSTEPPPLGRMIAGDLSTQFALQPGGGLTVTEASTLSLDARHPARERLATRPTSTIRLDLATVVFGSTDTMDLTATGAMVGILSGHTRHSVSPVIGLSTVDPRGVAYTSGYGSHPQGFTLILTHGPTSAPDTCLLEVRYDSDSPYDAGTVIFAEERNLDGQAHCGSATAEVAFRLTYNHGAPSH